MIMGIPYGNLLHKLWKITMFNGYINYKWPFSIARFNYQRIIMMSYANHTISPYIFRVVLYPCLIQLLLHSYMVCPAGQFLKGHMG